MVRPGTDIPTIHSAYMGPVSHSSQLQSCISSGAGFSRGPIEESNQTIKIAVIAVDRLLELRPAERLHSPTYQLLAGYFVGSRLEDFWLVLCLFRCAPRHFCLRPLALLLEMKRLRKGPRLILSVELWSSLAVPGYYWYTLGLVYVST